jgi:hypothetical protein
MRHSSTGHRDGTGWYEIRLGGHLDPRWVTRFDGMSLTALSDGTTLIQGPVTDQAALYGLLHRLGDLGLPLISVTAAGEGLPHPPGPTSPPSAS